jgi:hypothetical protein
MMKDTDWPTLCEGICFGLNRDAFGGPSFQGDDRADQAGRRDDPILTGPSHMGRSWVPDRPCPRK